MHNALSNLFYTDARATWRHPGSILTYSAAGASAAGAASTGAAAVSAFLARLRRVLFLASFF